MLATNEIGIHVKTNFRDLGQISGNPSLFRGHFNSPSRFREFFQTACQTVRMMAAISDLSTFGSSVKIPKASYISLGTAHQGSMHRTMTYINTFLSWALKKISGNQAENSYFPFVL